MARRRNKQRGGKRKEENGGGIDVHESNLVPAVVDENDNALISKFPNELGGFGELLKWLKDHECHNVGMESTGNYWKPIAAFLMQHGIRVHVANAEFVKGIPGKKTDEIDAVRLARYTRDGYMPDSNIVLGEMAELRNLTRMRSSFVSERTRLKNRVSAVVARTGLRLKLSDKLGKTGREVLLDLSSGKAVSEVFTPARCKQLGVTSTAEALAYLDRQFPQSMRCELQVLLDSIHDADTRIEQLGEAILMVANADERIRKEIELVKTIPGFADVAAPIVVAETGGFDRFVSSKHYSGYAGLVPEVEQSGDREKDGVVVKKVSKGRIRTRCNRHLKWIFMMAAESVMRLRTDVAGRLVRFFQRMRSRHRGRFGMPQSLAALAHKLARTVYAVVKSGKAFVGDKNTSKAPWVRRRKRGETRPEDRPLLPDICRVLVANRRGMVTSEVTSPQPLTAAGT